MSCLVELKCSRLRDQRCVSSLLLMTARQAKCDYPDKPTLSSTADGGKSENQRHQVYPLTHLPLSFSSLSQFVSFSPGTEAGDVSALNPQRVQLVSIIPNVLHLSLSP